MKDNLYFFHMIVFWLLVANIWWLFISMIVYTEWFLQYLFRFCLHHLLCFTDPEAQGNKEKIWILWEICFHCLLNDLQTKFKLIWTENEVKKLFGLWLYSKWKHCSHIPLWLDWRILKNLRLQKVLLLLNKRLFHPTSQVQTSFNSFEKNRYLSYSNLIIESHSFNKEEY